MNIRDIVNRIGYFRNKANLSARELSRRLGNAETYITRLEAEQFNLPTEKLLEILEVLNVSPAEFFADNYTTYNNDNSLIKLFCNLTQEDKNLILDFINRIKKSK